MEASVKHNNPKTRIVRMNEQPSRSEKCVLHETTHENFKHEALSAWTVFQVNGQHLTNLEVRDWLMTWGKDTETRIPSCHE
jgi:predicted transcriptional regulator